MNDPEIFKLDMPSETTEVKVLNVTNETTEGQGVRWLTQDLPGPRPIDHELLPLPTCLTVTSIFITSGGLTEHRSPSMFNLHAHLSAA